MKPNHTYKLEVRGATAIGRPSGSGDQFTVFAGAIADAHCTMEFETCNRFNKELRDQMIALGYLNLEQTPDLLGTPRYRLATDFTFSSPSCAASVLAGRQIDGIAEWRQYP